MAVGRLFNLSGPPFPHLQLYQGLYSNSCSYRRPPEIYTQAGEGTGNPIRGGCKGHEMLHGGVEHAGETGHPHMLLLVGVRDGGLSGRSDSPS